jgi:putative spermidine/putrescine transport system ATP-binding protein
MGEATGDLRIANISKNFGSTQALDNVSLDIASGEFMSLLGPSGCGKTTLLRCVAGLVEADGGDIRVAGRSLAGTPPWHRDIGVVFQNYALFPHMTVAQNVAFGLRMRGLGRTAIAAKVERALALVRMETFGARYPAQLSGGQQQRVALARAIAIEPTVLLLDEPMAALDAKLRGAMQLEIRELQSRLKITTVLVTHDQGEAMTMSDRIAIMSNGRIEQVAAPSELYLRPANSFVADFIGNTNRVNGLVVQTETGGKALRPDGEADLLLPLPPQAVAGQRVLLMVRPEAIEIVAGASGSGVAAVVQDRIMTGDRIAIFCMIGSLKVYGTVSSQAERLAALPPAGAAVTLTWRDSDAMLFPL